MGEQHLHLLALALVACSGALVMTPAAYHRQTAPREVSDSLLRLSSRLLLLAMMPLMLGIDLDFYLIARIIVADRLLSLLAAAALLAVFIALWFVWPRLSLAGRRRSSR